MNVILPSGLDAVVEKLAKRDKISRSSKVVQLLEVAIMIEEDVAWDSLAKERDKNGAKFLKHKDVWA